MGNKEQNKYFVGNVELVKKYGITSAVILGRIEFWVGYNKEKNQHFHDGHYWSGYLSAADLSEQIGLPTKTIRNNLNKLIKLGVLIKGNYNQKNYDKTNWYRINPLPNLVTSTTQFGNDPLPKLGTPIDQFVPNPLPNLGTPIPVNLTINHSLNHSVSNTGNLEKNILENTGENLDEDIVFSMESNNFVEELTLEDKLEELFKQAQNDFPMYPKKVILNSFEYGSNDLDKIEENTGVQFNIKLLGEIQGLMYQLKNKK